MSLRGGVKTLDSDRQASLPYLERGHDLHFRRSARRDRGDVARVTPIATYAM
jgi:hypothetical protein